MPTLPLERSIELIELAGFDSFEISLAEGWPSEITEMGPTQIAALRSRLDRSPLVLSGFTGNVPVLVPEERWPAHRNLLRRCLDLAGEFSDGTKRRYVSTTTGRADEWDVPDEAIEAVLIERFGQLAEDADARGAIIHLEPHVSTAVARPEMAARIVDAVAAPAFRLTLDISHFLVQGDDETVIVGLLGDRINAVEVKDQRGVVPDFQWLIPGEGEQDYPVFLRALAAAGFAGSVSAEISKLRQAFAGYDPEAAVTQTYATLSGAFRDAGIARSRDTS